MIAAYTCPVRVFTPAIEADLALFRLTHTVRHGASGVPYWERVALPAAGGVDDQSPQILDTLAWIARVANGVLLERAHRAAAERAARRSGR